MASLEEVTMTGIDVPKLEGDLDGDEDYCRVPSCWEAGSTVVIEGATETRLCDKHRKSFLGVTS